MHVFPVFFALLYAAVLEITCGPLAPNRPFDDPWQLQYEQAGLSLRGISAVNENVCWASGTGGTVLRTTDGGKTWRSTGPAVSEETHAGQHTRRLDALKELDFRDIEAFDADHAVIMSSGAADQIYRTENGGQSWTLVFEAPNPDAFFDGIAFANSEVGWLMGDPLDGRLLILHTRDGGRTWNELPSQQRPAVDPGEAGFAASGTNLIAPDPESLAIALGGAPKGDSKPSSHVWFTSDRGRSWATWEVPVRRSETSGLFSICHRPPGRWVAVGGDYRNSKDRNATVAYCPSIDQGWHLPPGEGLGGYRSCVAVVIDPVSKSVGWVAVGPDGTDLSCDDGMNWESVSNQGFHTVDFAAESDNGWAAGSDGRIARWNSSSVKPVRGSPPR